MVRRGLGFVDACSGCWLVLVPAVFWTLPWVLPSRFQVGCWLEVIGVSPSLSSLRSFAVEGVDMVLYQVLVGLLCLWTLGSGGVPTLPVGSPISGPVSVLPQSTTVTWLSLLWLGWLLVLVRFSCLRLTL